jgi:palmitoyltransferase ZDHHC1/11
MAFKRTNGFTYPPDKAQIISWLIILFLILMSYGTLVMSLKTPWNYIIGIAIGFLMTFHITFNIIVTVSNPGEEVASKRKVTPADEPFDRTKHKHVIENQFCNICQMIV